jgi:hypothetical protein
VVIVGYAQQLLNKGRDGTGSSKLPTRHSRMWYRNLRNKGVHFFGPS